MSGVLRLANTGGSNGRSTIVAAASTDATFTLPPTGGTLLTTSFDTIGDITWNGSNINITNADLNVDNGTLFVDESNSRVGIGTTSPRSLLSLGAGPATATATPDTLDLGGTYSTTAGANPKLRVFYDGTSSAGFGASAGQLDYTAITGNAHVFYAGTSQVMRINGSGNVGIGVSSLSSSSRLTLLESTGNGQTLEIKGANTGGVGSQPGIKFTASNGDNIGGIFGDTNSDAVILQSGGTERMRIYSSGVVSISKPGTANQANLVISSGGAGDPSTQDPRIQFAGSGVESAGTTEIRSTGSYNARALAFYTGTDTNGSERMQIDASGNLLIGTTNTNPAGNNANGTAILSGGRISAQVSGDHHRLGRGEDGIIVAFHSAGGVEGSISISGATTSYNTSSDYRLKENVVNIADGITRVKQLQPRRFNFIIHANKTVDGFLAHEAQTVVPEAVTGTHNEVDDNGNAVMQGIDQSKLVPLLTAALQETIAKVEALEAEVSKLRSK